MAGYGKVASHASARTSSANWATSGPGELWVLATGVYPAGNALIFETRTLNLRVLVSYYDR